MVTLNTVILTHDSPDNLRESMEWHAPMFQSISQNIYVYDNSEHTDNTELMKKYPWVHYHRHEYHGYDENFRYALENTPGDYVWIIGDKLKIELGTIPFLFDFIQRESFSAVIMGMNHRLEFLDEPIKEYDFNHLMSHSGWHTTLCGSTIYSREIIDLANKDRFMGTGFAHTCILFDGISRLPYDATTHKQKPVLIVIHTFLKYLTKDPTPTWLPRAVEIWTKDMIDAMDRLPEYYTKRNRIYLIRNNGLNGMLLSEDQFISLATMGYFTREILEKNMKHIRRVCKVPVRRLREIARIYED
jgi:hypothetical protein